MLNNIFPSLFFLIPIASLTIIIIKALIDPLRSIPGPFLARFTRLWYLYQLYQGDFERTNIELHRRYGAVVRIAPGEYSIDDVEGARMIYGSGSGFVKAPWYLAWGPLDPEKVSLFADVNASRHSIQRRKFAAAYSMSSLVTYEPFVENCGRLVVERFSELASLGKEINLAHWLQCYAFDVIGEVTFANRFGFLNMGEDESGVFEAIDAANSYSTFAGVFPWLHKLIFPIMNAGSGGIAYLGAFTAARVSDRQKSMKDPKNSGRAGPPDFLQKFIMAHEENPQKMKYIDIMAICHSNIRAGSDTTAISLSSIFYHLLKYPSTYQKLRKEIDDAAAIGKVSDPITFKEAQELPYLQAVIKEALRMHPAVGLPLARIVPAQGATIAGINFPAGSTLGINAWVAHRNKSVYGPDADYWSPERWLEIEEQGRGGEVEKYFLAFGQGSRTCIGKNLSLLEMSKLVPTLVRKFDFQLSDSLRDEGSRWKTLNRWFVKQTDFESKVMFRKA